MSNYQYVYYAFISYSHKDEKWAKWLQRKLENYRLPSSIWKKYEGSIPRHVRPIFRDKTDIGVGQTVRNRLRQELSDSRYLIVVCSPESAKSDFVDMEIQNFQDMGRADRIIPFIVKGTPDPKNPGEEQCYPPSLQQGKDTMLGASLEELSPNEALVKIVAAILGLKYDHLWQRHKRRQQFWIIGYTTATCLLLALSYGIIDYYYIVNIRHYDDYIARWGVPEGIDRLSSDQVSHRASSWRLEILGGKPRRLTRVGPTGKAQPPLYSDEQDRPDDQIFYYGENGRVTNIDDYSYTNKFIKRREYTQDLEYIRFRLNTGLGNKSLSSMKASFITGDEPELTNKISDISAFRYHYNHSGVVVQEQYLNAAGGARADANGIYAQHFRYTPEGRLESITNLDDKGKPLAVNGVAEKRFQYTPSGFRSTIEWLDENGELVLSQERAAKVMTEADAWGNRVQSTFLDTQEKPCLHKNGYAKIERENDAHGRMIKLTCRGTDGERCFSIHKISVAKYSYNEQGRLGREAYFDINENPCYNDRGFSAIEKRYDERGNSIFETFYGTDGKPCVSSEGYAIRSMTYDASGSLIKTALFGLDGKPCMAKLGYSIEVITYNNKGNKIRTAYFDQAGQPCLLKAKYSVLSNEYDEQGNVIKETSLGTDGQPCVSDVGVATTVTQYDNNGNEIQQSYYDEHDKPCLREGHFSTIKWSYSKNGIRRKEAYFDANGRPGNRGDGVSTIFSDHDKFGKVAKIKIVGADGQPSKINNEVAFIQFEYDQRGNIIRLSCFDVNNRPRALPAGDAIVQHDYDARGNLIKTSFFGQDGLPCLHNGEYASQELTYDARDNKIKEAYYDIFGKPCLNNDGIAGWTDLYDERNNKISHTTFGLGNTNSSGVQMARIGDVIPQSQADLHGIKRNDVLFEFCYWRWDKDKELSRLQEAIDSCKTYSKHILTVSQDGRVHSFDAPVGVIGIELQHVTFTNQQASGLRAYYDRFVAADSK